MSVKSYFESERRKKQITWMLIILGALFIGAMLSSYYSDDKKPASVPQTTSTTQISMVPSKADYEPKLPRNSSVLTFSLSGFAGICC